MRELFRHDRWDIVTTDYSFAEIQQALIESIDAIDADLDEVLREISPHELPGKMGYPDSPIEGYELNQLIEETSKLLRECRAEVADADTTADILIAFGQVADGFHEPDIKPDDQFTVPNSILEGVAANSDFFDYLSQQSSHDFKTAAEEFVIDLYSQDLLSTACRVMIAYFTFDEKLPINYGNTAMTDVIDLFETIQKTDDASEFEIRKLAEMYRRCGVYYETALPPFLALIYVLEQEEAELEKIRRMQLANAVSKVRNFSPLQVFVKEFDTNIRNAVEHGGTSGYNPNPRREVVEFVYEIGDETVSMELSYDEFRGNTLNVCYAAMALYVMPVYILLMYPYLLILDEYDELNL